MTEDIAQVSARAEALECDIVAARRERDSLRAELAACRAERDRLRLLRESEEARYTARLEAMAADSRRSAGRALAAEELATTSARTVDELTRELTAIRGTLSWRLTRPLRAVRRWLPGS